MIQERFIMGHCGITLVALTMSDSIQHPIDYFKSEQKVRKTSISSSDQLPGKALREIQRNRWKTTIATLRQEASALQEQDHVDKPLSAKERWLKKKKELLEEDAALQCPPREKSYRDRLIEFYTIHNPEKLSTVDRTLETYKGKEEELFTRLKEKYLQVFPSLIERKRQFPLTNSSNTTVYLDMSIGNSFIGRIVIRLLDEIVPLAAENFKLLCTGEVASDLHFKGSYFHRIVRNFMIQGGDITKGDGTGGVSAFRSTPKANMWGNFKDETFLPHDSVGLLSMANHGKNTNGSQFFITTKDAPHLDNKHVVFGEVIEGLDVVDKIQVVPVNKNSRPLEGYEVKIEDCGQLG